MQLIHEWITCLFPAGGWFVEAGAHDGVGDSATWALEQDGWSGLCVEPSRAFAGLRASRDCQVDNRALWSVSGDSVEFLELAGNAVELSGIAASLDSRWDRRSFEHATRMVETVTLTDLLAEHQAPAFIEFLSLDIEGAELAVLGAHDFDRFGFGAIAVEHNADRPNQQAIRTLLLSHGYRLAVADAWSIEDWFLRKDIRFDGQA